MLSSLFILWSPWIKARQVAARLSIWKERHHPARMMSLSFRRTTKQVNRCSLQLLFLCLLRIFVPTCFPFKERLPIILETNLVQFIYEYIKTLLCKMNVVECHLQFPFESVRVGQPGCFCSHRLIGLLTP